MITFVTMALKQEMYDVLNMISNGKLVNQLKSNFAQINGAIIHCRYKSIDKNKSYKYPFNINQATLKADYELWVCDKKCYYLIPIGIIKSIYDDPDAYKNKTEGQENIRTLTVNIDSNMVYFGRNGKKYHIENHKNVVLFQ